MSRPLFIMRPEPGWSASVQAARDLGLEVMGAPIFAIEPTAWYLSGTGRFDGILAGSANAFRHGGQALDSLRHLPVYAVGDTTAGAARDAGFTIARTGTAGLQSLLDAVAGESHNLLRLAGEDRVRLISPKDVLLEERIVYRSVPLPLADEFTEQLRGGGVAALHSGAAARYFRAECARLGIAPDGLDLAVLGPRIAALAGSGWQCVHIAETPDEAALLALASALCK